MARKATDNEWQRLAVALCFKDEKHMYEVLYLQEMLSVNEISDRLKCGTATLNRRMAMYKIPKRARGGSHYHGDKRAILWHMDQRVVMAMTNTAIAKSYDFSYSVVYHYRRWKSGGDMSSYNINNSGSKYNSNMEAQ